MPQEKSPGNPTTRRYSNAEKAQAVRLVRELDGRPLRSFTALRCDLLAAATARGRHPNGCTKAFRCPSLVSRGPSSDLAPRQTHPLGRSVHHPMPDLQLLPGLGPIVRDMLKLGRASDVTLTTNDLVADVGGGHNPNRLASYVIDLAPLDEVIPYANSQALRRFNDSSWIVHDICSSTPVPVPDQYFDFVFSTHILEDIRDPLRACEELQRIAKAGYIEVPSIESELTYRLESRHHTGRWHHRWLVSLEGDSIVFRHKPAFVNGWWMTRIPRSWWGQRDPGSDVMGILWSDSFSFREDHFVYEGLRLWIEAYVRKLGVYPRWRYELWGLMGSARRWAGLVHQTRTSRVTDSSPARSD